MNTYSVEVMACVNVQAPSLEDALASVEDVFGAGEMEEFDMNVVSFSVKAV